MSQIEAQTPHPEPNNSPRIGWIDIAKGIAILLVITGHTLTSGELSWKAIFSFHMPLFFLLAGVTFKTKEWRILIPTSAKRLLLPFVLMFILLAIVGNPSIFLHPDQLLASLTYSLAYQPKQLSWHVDIAYVGAIWFLLCMFISRLYLNALLKIFARFSIHLAAQIVIMCALGYCGVLLGRYLLIPFVLDIALIATLFMYIGWVFKTYNLFSYLTSWKAIILAIVIWLFCFFFSALEMGARDYSMFPLAVLGACAASVVCIKMSMIIDQFPQRHTSARCAKAIKRYFSYMGKNSMTVFCLHCFEYCVIDWRALPFISGLPFEGLFAASIRILFVSLSMLLLNIL